jgi:ABC-2 type transport system ATP-binding protein
MISPKTGKNSMPETVIQTQNLIKRYNGLTAVDDLSLGIYQGEVFGLLGPNGAGKTTSISMICGLLQPDAGQVLIQGQPVHGGDVEVRARVGVCPQEVILWEKLTCLEQLEFVGEMYNVPRKIARQRGQELLETLGLTEKGHKLASTLSGGMQRRLNLALALVHDPEILVLDEPEAGLDPQSRVLVREYVRSLARLKTIILTTHNMDEADRMADRVAIIDHGKLLVLDTPEALKRSIGEGDVLELEIKGISAEQAWVAIEETHPNLTSLKAALAERSNLSLATEEIASSGLPQVSPPRNNVIVVRGQNIVDRLPPIITAIQKAGGQVGEVHVRANTLEDVFISLTGRRLRQ